MHSNLKNEIQDSKDFEMSIKKYPFFNSIHLIDYFLIVGYEEAFINEKIIKSIQNKDNSSSNNNKFKCKEYPTILSSINIA